MADGFKFTGKGSWFGGPRDSMDSGKMAGGNTTALPAVAVRLPGKSWRDSRKYLNKYVRVTAPNGKSAVYRIGDLGPNESTGRNVDITYSGLHRLGYTEGNFPTDAKFKVEYIGDKPDQPVASRGASGKKIVKGVSAPTETFDSEGYDAARRKAIGNQLLAQRNPNSILVKTGVLDSTPPNPEDFKIAQRSSQTRAATRGTDATAPAPRAGASLVADGSQPAGDSLVQRLRQRADAIDRKRLPYKWGGGHGSKINPFKATPLDCSGAVSAVLRINPKVSGEFTKWGKPGRGGRVTIYANSTHVLMEIDGKFFGTSGSNPGGGAGWIPRSKVSRAYLSKFTARHI